MKKVLLILTIMLYGSFSVVRAMKEALGGSTSACCGQGFVSECSIFERLRSERELR